MNVIVPVKVDIITKLNSSEHIMKDATHVKHAMVNDTLPNHAQQRQTQYVGRATGALHVPRELIQTLPSATAAKTATAFRANTGRTPLPQASQRALTA